jgi:hypothetical protein
MAPDLKRVKASGSWENNCCTIKIQMESCHRKMS